VAQSAPWLGEAPITTEELLLAAQVILGLGEDDLVPATLETELGTFRDRVQVALI
jgi:hypothetical protein